MKIAAIVLSALLVLSLVGFGFSVLAAGEHENLEEALDGLGSVNSFAILSFGGGYGEDVSFVAEEAFSDIEISVISAEVEIDFSDNGTASVEYDAGNSNIKLVAEVSDGKLIIKEKSKITLISFPFFGSNTKKSTLNIKIPEKQYKNVELSMVSGNVEADGITAEKLMLSTTSGKANISAFAEKIEINTVSGDIHLKNCTDKAAISINSSSVSGKTVLDGYRPEKFDLSAVSGNIEMYGAAGKGSVSITSGNARLDYTEWNNKLDISAISGDIDVYLPEGSGMDIDFSRISGELNYNLNGEKNEIRKSGNYSVYGTNTQEVSVSITSGSVNFKNN